MVELNDKIAAKKIMYVILYSLGKASFRMLAKIFNTSSFLAYRWIAEAGYRLPNQETLGNITQLYRQSLTRRDILSRVKNKLWIIKTVDHSKRKAMTRKLGCRDTTTSDDSMTK